MCPGTSPDGRPFAHVVLGTREHTGGSKIVAVPSLDGGGTERCDQLGVL